MRERDLPGLLKLWPVDLEPPGAGGQAAVVARLRKALRDERRRGACRHPSYDLARHARLLAAYRAEVARDPASARATGSGCPRRRGS